MSLYVRRSIKATATVQRGVLNDLWNKVPLFPPIDARMTRQTGVELWLWLWLM